MSFIRKKTIRGRQYLYEVESVWENGRVRQRYIAYKGAVEPKRPRRKTPEAGAAAPGSEGGS